VPFDPTHPDPDQLAAWQAGDLTGPDGAQVEAHVAGCAECAGLVAMAARGRSALTGLAEVEPPAGLHQRLAAAVERELEVGDGVRARHGLADGNGREERRLAAAAADADGLGESAPVATPIPLARRRRPRPRDRRMVAVLSTAAAVILLVAGLVPLLRHGGGQTTATADGGATAAPSALASGPVGSLPVFSAPDGYSGTALQSALASDPQARSAYQRAAGARLESRDLRSDSRQIGGGGAAAKSTTSGGSSGDTAAGPPANPPAGLQQSVCVATARDQAGDQGLRPAFFVDTVYRGRPASVLVTVRPDASDQADLWAFPRGNCSSPPFAHDPVKVTPP
jgi:Putative zinc-finger